MPGEIGFPGKPGHPGLAVSIPTPTLPCPAWVHLGGDQALLAGHQACWPLAVPFLPPAVGTEALVLSLTPSSCGAFHELMLQGWLPYRAPARVQTGAPSPQATPSVSLPRGKFRSLCRLKCGFLSLWDTCRRQQVAGLSLFLSSSHLLTPPLRRSWGAGGLLLTFKS